MTVEFVKKKPEYSIELSLEPFKPATDIDYFWVKPGTSFGWFMLLHGEYSTDGIHWQHGENIEIGSTGSETTYVRSTAGKNAIQLYGYNSNARYIIGGHLSTLFSGSNTMPDDFNAKEMFMHTNIEDASALVLPDFTTKGCYLNMFESCRYLSSPPELPATTLAQSCYRNMFVDSAITEAPELPATILADSCYFGMFSGCENLTAAPALPATTLATACYEHMFNGCRFTDAPELPATALAPECYKYMFSGCTRMVYPPVLPATELADSCYSFMFSDCARLTVAPELPASVMKPKCYYQMFGNCTALETAPALPAMELAANCYQYMFSSCTALIKPPALPATTAAENCYNGMFQGCASLAVLPNIYCTRTKFALQEDYLDSIDLYYTFSRCTSLKVYSTPGEGHEYAYTIPAVGSTGTSRDSQLWQTFFGVPGDFTSTNDIRFRGSYTVYTQNPPL